MTDLMEPSAAKTDYDQRPISQHGIHKPEEIGLLHFIWFLDVGLNTVGSNVGPLTFSVPENTFTTVRMPKMPCLMPSELLPFPVYDY